MLFKTKYVTTIKSFCLLGLLCICFKSIGQITEANYKIYDVKAGKETTLEKIAEDMTQFDVLFFGEEHNDSVTHFLEHKMLETLFAKFGQNTALSMEMFDRDVQTVMNEYLNGFIREKNFIKDARTWNNYRDYKPMVELAKNNKLDVICANSPSRYTNLAGRKGQKALMELPVESKKHFAPLPYDTASGPYYEKLMALTSHAPQPSTDSNTPKMAVMPMGGFNLIMGQSLWDATMAYSISEYLKKNKGRKIMQVNGRFHSDEGFAINTQLKKYSPKIKSLIISTGADESFPEVNWEEHKHLGDYIIITDPNVPRTYKE
jgi:uncharacterized iron-regulated protein